MTEKTSPLSIERIQRAKAQEFYHFFRRSNPAYTPHLNHLDEISWMTPQQAAAQHEFFDYHETPLLRLKRKFGHVPLSAQSNISPEERELRLQYRSYLERHFLGKTMPETEQMLPKNWQHPFSDEEIEHVSIPISTYESLFHWNKAMLLPLLGILVVVAFGVAHALSGANHHRGSILIESNTRGAAIFLNGEKRGYADFRRLLSDVPPGEYRLELRKIGYASQPVQVVLAKDKPSAKVFIPMSALGVENQGHLLIVADNPASKLFIDDEYIGILEEVPVFPLETGDHQIMLELEGVRTSPQRQWVRISAGDTSTVRFAQTIPAPHSSTPGVSTTPSRIGQGMISIASNTIGGRIVLNGEDTGKESDHVFTGMPYGEYRVRLVREGYKSIPAERLIALSHNTPSLDISFELVKQFERVKISTEPPNGEIFVNGESRGKGSFTSELGNGEYQISFGRLAGYNTPKQRTIRVSPNSPAELQVIYFPQVRALVRVTSNGNIETVESNLINGYTMNDRVFTSSQKEGSKVVYHDKTAEYYWKLGYTFPNRTTRGSDILKMTFALPREYRQQSKFYLNLQAAASEEKYPLSLSRKSDVKIKLNGNILSYYYQPKLLEDLGGLEQTRWDIGEYLKPGMNTLEIGVTEKNNAYYYIKHIEVTNVE